MHFPRAIGARDDAILPVAHQGRAVGILEHADLDALIDRAATDAPVDELMIRRLKKRRLALRDVIARVERELDPNEPA